MGSPSQFHNRASFSFVTDSAVLRHNIKRVQLPLLDRVRPILNARPPARTYARTHTQKKRPSRDGCYQQAKNVESPVKRWPNPNSAKNLTKRCSVGRGGRQAKATAPARSDNDVAAESVDARGNAPRTISRFPVAMIPTCGSEGPTFRVDHYVGLFKSKLDYAVLPRDREK